MRRDGRKGKRRGKKVKSRFPVKMERTIETEKLVRIEGVFSLLAVLALHL